MKVLLDTHTLLWFLNGDDDKLPESVKDIILNQENKKFVSIISFLEISIKTSLGKLKLDNGFKNLIEATIFNGFEILDISLNHTLTLSELEFIHRDPFDRILVSQAIVENLTILTKDGYIKNYNVKSIW